MKRLWRSVGRVGGGMVVHRHQTGIEVPKNGCFWTVVQEKTLESLLDSKEIQPVHPKGNQSWTFIGRTDAEAEAPILWPPDAKNQVIGKDPDAGQGRGQEKEMTEDEMVGWHQSLSMTQWTWVCANSRRQWRSEKPGVPWGRRVGHGWVTEQQKKHINILMMAQLCLLLWKAPPPPAQHLLPPFSPGPQSCRSVDTSSPLPSEDFYFEDFMALGWPIFFFPRVWPQGLEILPHHMALWTPIWPGFFRLQVPQPWGHTLRMGARELLDCSPPSSPAHTTQTAGGHASSWFTTWDLHPNRSASWISLWDTV